MVARGNHVLHQNVLDQYINCQGTFIWHLTSVLLTMTELIISALYMILGILQGCLLGPILK